jgi:uncharacterized membrane protein YbhN (UPF0104 family)
MLAHDHPTPELALPTVDVRSLLRRLVLPAALAAAVAVVLLAGGGVHALRDAVRRVGGLNGGWAAVGGGLEFISLTGYVILLSLVVGRVTPRVRTRESAQITLAGVAATRLLPTAGAGGAAVTLWVLRRAGVGSRTAARALLALLVLLYAVFLAAIVSAGTALALGLVHSRGPGLLSAVPAVVAAAGIALALAIASQRRFRRVQLLGDAVRDGCRLVRSGDVRIAGALAYWLCDAAVLWAMLHAFGSPPALPVVALAYFVGQAANTLPIPGSVSGGIAAVLIAFGVPAGLALTSVLAYRTISVWLPTPVALAALPGLRSTIARWAREDAAQPVG